MQCNELSRPLEGCRFCDRARTEEVGRARGSVDTFELTVASAPDVDLSSFLDPAGYARAGRAECDRRTNCETYSVLSKPPDAIDASTELCRLSFECPWGYEAKLEEEGAPGWDLHTMADTPGQPRHEGKRRVCRPREG